MHSQAAAAEHQQLRQRLLEMARRTSPPKILKALVYLHRVLRMGLGRMHWQQPTEVVTGLRPTRSQAAAKRLQGQKLLLVVGKAPFLGMLATWVHPTRSSAQWQALKKVLQQHTC